MIDELTRQLRADEGVRRTVYKDTLGLWTIGVGRLVDPSKPGAGLRDSEIDMMLRNDIHDRLTQLADRLPWFYDLSDPRQGVLVNMAFQLGVNGLMEFKTTLDLVRRGQYAEAAVQMLKSKWALQTPQRARRLAQQMALGEWVFQ